MVRQASEGWNPNVNLGSGIPEFKARLMQRSREQRILPASCWGQKLHDDYKGRQEGEK